MSKVVVLGSGMQGTACAYDLAFNPSITEVVIADIELNKAQESVQKINHPKVAAQQVDVKNQTALIEFLKPFDVLISAVPYFFNYNITQAAIASKTHMVDMGGNTDLVFKQRTLTQEAQAAGVTVLPDAGLAPGMANILAVHAINQLENVNTVQIRVGGLPKFPKPPLNYQLFFSVHGLINEYMGRSVVLKNGKIEEVETLTEIEPIHFRDPIGSCEAFHTLGGISTLPWAYEGKIKTMDYKTIRYPGHCAQIKMMADLGLLDEAPVQVNGQAVVPRDVFAALVTPRLTFQETEDYVIVRISVKGERSGEPVQLTYEIIDSFDAKTGFTAMMRTTAFPVSILAQMMAEGVIQERGVLPLETAVPTDYFLKELEKRAIKVSMETIALEEAHAHC